jgi:hypothetical protein
MRQPDSGLTLAGIIFAVLALACIFGSNEGAIQLVGFIWAFISAYCFWKGKGGNSDTGTKY